jgi:hypothetical protein
MYIAAGQKKGAAHTSGAQLLLAWLWLSIVDSHIRAAGRRWPAHVLLENMPH